MAGKNLNYITKSYILIHSSLYVMPTSLNNFSMNLDELVKNVISVDENHHFMQHPSSNSSSSSNNNIDLNAKTLSKKSVDEVWKEIVGQEEVNNLNAVDQASSSINHIDETSLEDFLLRAGLISTRNQQDFVLNSQPLMGIDQVAMIKQQPNWLQFHQDHQQHQPLISIPTQAVVDSNFQVSDLGFENSIVNADCGDCQIADGGNRKRQLTDEMMEKSIERRQRRMIKNRESAARSRARKQAYTNKLEQQGFQLRKTNNWLKKRKEVKILLNSVPASAPRYQLRRTSSTTF